MMILFGFSLLCFFHVMVWIYLFANSFLRSSDRESHEGVSIIIAIKNEEENIGQLLKAVSGQIYPNFEVIVVNDYSSDKSAQIVSAFEGALQLKTMIPSIDQKGKKLALSEGIMQASNDLILLTDGDCIPQSKKWIQSMADHINGKDVCIGYGPLLANNLPSFFAKMEGIWIALQYLAFASRGLPYMAVGRNMMFRKEAFVNLGGYSTHMDIASGDDDLLIQQMAHASNVAVNLEADSWVYSKAPETWNSLVKQKVRHLSTATSYGNSSKWMLGLLSGIHLLIYGVLLLLLFTNFWQTALLVIATKWVIQMIVQWKWAASLGGLSYSILFPLTEASLSVYYLLLSPFLWWRKRNEW